MVIESIPDTMLASGAIPMVDDDSVDAPLLVETLLDGPGVGYALLYSRWGEFYIYAVPIGMVVVAFIGWIAYQASGHDIDKFLVAMVFAGAVNHWIFLAAAAAIAMYPLYKIWRDAGVVWASGITHHGFSRDGVELRTSEGSSTIAWQDMSRALETQKGFLFYKQGKLATFVPRSCLAGAAETNIVRKFIRQNVANATLLG